MALEHELVWLEQSYRALFAQDLIERLLAELSRKSKFLQHLVSDIGLILLRPIPDHSFKVLKVHSNQVAFLRNHKLKDLSQSTDSSI